MIDRKLRLRASLSRWIALLVVLAPARAQADPPARDEQPPAPEQLTLIAVDDGAFLPLTGVSAPGDPVRATVAFSGGLDAAAGAPLVRANATLELAGPLAVTTGVHYDRTDGQLAPDFGLLLRLTPAHAATRVLLTARYEGAGYEGEPEGQLGVALAQRRGCVGLFAEMAVGRELDEAQGDASAGMAVLVRVADRVRVGLDARGTLDLDGGRPAADELDDVVYSLASGPTVNVVVGRFVVFGWAGASGIELGGEPARWGVAASGGIGTAF